jgi:SM-20-related protein
VPYPGISVHDGLLAPELFAQLAGAMSWVPMYFQRPADRDPSAHPLDGYSFYPLASVDDKRSGDAEPVLQGLDPSLVPVQDAWQVVRRTAGAVRLYECEYTANPFGSEGHPHHDCLTPERRQAHVTAILYCNTDWQLAWAGETVVFDRHGDITAAVIPRPGRIAIIRGDPLHAARGVARICPVPRRVLVFKMWETS